MKNENSIFDVGPDDPAPKFYPILPEYLAQRPKLAIWLAAASRTALPLEHTYWANHLLENLCAILYLLIAFSSSQVTDMGSRATSNSRSAT